MRALFVGSVTTWAMRSILDPLNCLIAEFSSDCCRSDIVAEPTKSAATTTMRRALWLKIAKSVSMSEVIAIRQGASAL